MLGYSVQTEYESSHMESMLIVYPRVQNTDLHCSVNVTKKKSSLRHFMY